MATIRYVVSYDGSNADEVIESAFAFARIAPAELHVLRTFDDDVAPAALLVELKKKLHAAVEREIARHGALRVATVIAHVAFGRADHALLDLAEDIVADAIIVQQGAWRALGGDASLGENVVRFAACEVLVARSRTNPGLRKVRDSQPGPHAHVYSFSELEKESA